jgi:hypothetical protein
MRISAFNKVLTSASGCKTIQKCIYPTKVLQFRSYAVWGKNLWNYRSGDEMEKSLAVLQSCSH